MALEDLSLFRALPGSTVFYPSDAVSTERAVELAANTKGVCFIRSSRPATTQGTLIFFQQEIEICAQCIKTIIHLMLARLISSKKAHQLLFS